MADTQAGTACISRDTRPLRLTDAAVKRARRVTGHNHLDDVAAQLGLPRITFYRLRTGTDPRLSLALALAHRLNMPLTRLFEPTEADTDG